MSLFWEEVGDAVSLRLDSLWLIQLAEVTLPFYIVGICDVFFNNT